MKGKSTYHIAKEFSLFFLSLMEDPWRGNSSNTEKKTTGLKQLSILTNKKDQKSVFYCFFLVTMKMSLSPHKFQLSKNQLQHKMSRSPRVSQPLLTLKREIAEIRIVACNKNTVPCVKHQWSKKRKAHRGLFQAFPAPHHRTQSHVLLQHCMSLRTLTSICTDPCLISCPRPRW